MIDFTVISTKNVSLDASERTPGKRVTGVDEVYWLLVVPLGTPNIEEAVDRAIESAGPGYDALVDGVVYRYEYWYVLTARSGVRVEGTAINTKDLRAADGKESEQMLYHSRGR